MIFFKGGQHFGNFPEGAKTLKCVQKHIKTEKTHKHNCWKIDGPHCGRPCLIVWKTFEFHGRYAEFMLKINFKFYYERG